MKLPETVKTVFHWLFATTFLYLVTYFGATEYAKNHEAFYVTIFADLSAFMRPLSFAVVLPLAVYSIIAFAQGNAIEAIQQSYFKAAAQTKDIVSTTLGGPTAVILFIAVGMSKFLLWASVAFQAFVVVYSILMIVKHLKKK